MSILGETPGAASDLQAQVGQAMLLQVKNEPHTHEGQS